MKKIRSRQTAILVLNRVNWIKQFFPVSIVKHNTSDHNNHINNWYFINVLLMFMVYILRTFILRNSWDSVVKIAPYGDRRWNVDETLAIWNVETLMKRWRWNDETLVLSTRPLKSRDISLDLNRSKSDLSERYAVYANTVRLLGRFLVSLSCQIPGDTPISLSVGLYQLARVFLSNSICLNYLLSENNVFFI